MNIEALKSELTNDQTSRGYSGMSDELVAKSFARTDRQVDRTEVTGGMIAAAIARTEYAALSAADKQYIQMLIPAQSLPVTATLKAELAAVFPNGSTTRANLVALLKRPGNRADELNLGRIPTPSDVANARRKE